jgi:tetratricopeptide (TPR) repeat protein
VKGAEPRFDQAIALHPLLAEAWINLGVVAAERGDEKRARELFTRALKWTPGDVSLLFNRSLSAMNAGRTKEALDDIERAVLESPGNPALDHYRGLLLAKVLSPDAWDRHQRTLVAEGEVLRKAGRLRQGLEGRYFADRHLKREVALRVDRAINFEWRWSEPHQGVPSDEFSIRWKGLVDIPEDGVFAFITAANDGIRVWVDGVRIIDNWKENEGAVNQERLKLIRGLHPFRIDYFEASRFAGVTFTVKRADASRALGAERFFHVP